LTASAWTRRPGWGKVTQLEVVFSLIFVGRPALFWRRTPPVPPARPLEFRARIGILGSVNIGLPEVIQRVLASDRDLAISRINPRGSHL